MGLRKLCFVEHVFSQKPTDPTTASPSQTVNISRPLKYRTCRCSTCSADSIPPKCSIIAGFPSVSWSSQRSSIAQRSRRNIADAFVITLRYSGAVVKRTRRLSTFAPNVKAGLEPTGARVTGSPWLLWSIRNVMKARPITEAESAERTRLERKLVGMYGVNSGNEDEIIDQAVADIHEQIAKHQSGPAPKRSGHSSD